MKKKTITVTENDIAMGERGSYCECPIARAVRRAFRAPASRDIHVRHDAIVVGDLSDDVVWFALPNNRVNRFIDNFDAGKRVKPTRFELNFR